MPPSKKLFLLDAMALIYRAHFAFSKNPRITSKGKNTGAILGFTNSLIEILKKEKPTHIAVAFDTFAPTFRHESYTEYKANRQETPEDILESIPYIKKILDAYQIPILELDGYEADDIIGTFAKKAATEGFEVYMMTPDKDYSQLVEDHVFLYKPAFMGNGVEVLGVKEVLEKWDIERVDQVTDILGLQGDSVDNIPGIPGIGAKTAVKLIKTYDTVENLVDNAHELKGKQKEKVIEFADQGILSKSLATININVPLAFDEKALIYDGPNKEKLNAIFEELEFRTLAKRVFGEEEVKAPQNGQQTSLFDTVSVKKEEQPLIVDKNTVETVDHDYHLIDTPELQKKLVYHMLQQEAICFDTETTSLQAHEAELVGISVAYYSGEAYYIPIPESFEEAKKLLYPFKVVFEDKSIVKIGQNIKYDLMVLSRYGIDVQGPLFDTMLAHYLLEPETRHNMDAMAESLLNYTPISITKLIGEKGKKQGNMRDVPVNKVVDYAAEDADITLQLKEKLDDLLKKEHLEKLFSQVETPLIPVLASMEHEGVKLDTSVLEKMSEELAESIQVTEKRIYDIAGVEFNIASPKQLGEVLFDKLKLVENPKKTKTKQYATGEEILSKLANEHEIAEKILEYRELQKLKSTYVDALPALISKVDGRVHTSYNQAVAATGRLSSTNPNLQNIPIRTPKGREIRKAFVARNEEYLFMSADYSQIELRIMASFAEDSHMVDAFKESRDIHAATASKIFKVAIDEVTPEMRRKAKTANFGIIYGISAFGLSQRLNIPRKEAKDIIDTYFQEFPGVKNYMDRMIEEAKQKEYVETLLGRRRYLRDINSRNATMRGYAERNAINAPIQGTAADMIKVAMINIFEWMKQEKLKSRMIMQVHDELIFDAYRDEVEKLKVYVEKLMKDAMPLKVPIEVGIGIGENWLDAH